MEVSDLTSGQLESLLSDRIQNLYFNQLKHQLKQVSCQLYGDELIIILENTVTAPEHLLNQSHQKELAEQVRGILDGVIQPQLRALVEEILQVRVVDFLSNTTLDTGRTGVIAILGLEPKMPPPSAAWQKQPTT
ncbi:MAG TPA: hypothetical protein DDZ80_21095 [Cyanobacteria bacterium UBA8803]|nr:hypothetical protein [Cyanobacteria bacterium UBA9273]HBL60839.1 hypothetical protein [Cyanobacteria bacterium UBA8803]